MTDVTFEVTLQEGYADQLGPKREGLQRSAVMGNVPRKGDTVEIGWGHTEVKWVDWDPWDGTIFIRLGEVYTLAEPWPDVLAALKTEGWR